MSPSMKRVLPFAACAIGIAVVLLLLPRFNVAQPAGIRLTRGDAIALADTEAARLGIPVDKAWPILTWAGSPLLEKELANKPDLRRRANDDAVIGPRLGGYKRTYFRYSVSKFTPYGSVVVDEETGKILM